MSEHVCGTKIVYYTKSSAKKNAKWRNLRWYECPHCRFFHLSRLSHDEFRRKEHYYKVVGKMTNIGAGR